MCKFLMEECFSILHIDVIGVANKKMPPDFISEHQFSWEALLHYKSTLTVSMMPYMLLVFCLFNVKIASSCSVFTLIYICTYLHYYNTVHTSQCYMNNIALFSALILPRKNLY